jgi:hypothetical protein
VTFTSQADAQLAWIAARSPLPLRERIVNTLMLGPQPHPYRRIRHGKDGGMTLAIQDWRIDFRVDGLVASVHGLRTGYDKSQLASGQDDPPGAPHLHREFSATFA